MACRRCSECVGEEHHWIENGEFAEAGDPEFECKHCDAACAAVYYFMIPPYEAEANVCEFFIDRDAIGRASSTSFKESSS